MRPCFVCGAPGLCEDREPDLLPYYARYEALLIQRKPPASETLARKAASL